MPIVNFSNTFTVVLALILFVLVLYLGKTTERSWLLAGAVMVFLTMFVGHVCEITFMKNVSESIVNALRTSIIFDFIFVIISFGGYAWINYTHAKEDNNKVLEENSNFYSKKNKHKNKK